MLFGEKFSLGRMKVGKLQRRRGSNDVRCTPEALVVFQLTQKILEEISLPILAQTFAPEKENRKTRFQLTLVGDLLSENEKLGSKFHWEKSWQRYMSRVGKGTKLSVICCGKILLRIFLFFVITRSKKLPK